MARLAGGLSHPLTLLLVGALVTSLVVPSITRQWQDHEKELAVKSELVEQMTAQTSRFLAAIQIARVTGNDKDAVKAVNDAYKQWLTDSAVLSARLDARLPDEGVATRWRAYVHLVEDLYALGDATDEESMAAEAKKILNAYQRTGKPLSDAGEAERRRLVVEKGNTPEHSIWLALYGEALGQRDAIAQDILDAGDVEI